NLHPSLGQRRPPAFRECVRDEYFHSCLRPRVAPALDGDNLLKVRFLSSRSPRRRSSYSHPNANAAESHKHPRAQGTGTIPSNRSRAQIGAAEKGVRNARSNLELYLARILHRGSFTESICCRPSNSG